METTTAIDLARRFKRMAEVFAINRTFLPESVEINDLVQEALCVALESEGRFVSDGRAKFSTYLQKPVAGRWSTFIAQQNYGPSAYVRHWRKKNGKQCDYGEVSIECFADGNWQEWLASIPADTAGEVEFVSLHIDSVAECLRDIRGQMKAANDVGISWAKTRGKWHVEVVVCGNQQFLGQFATKDSARTAKAAFLESFMDAVLDATEDYS